MVLNEQGSDRHPLDGTPYLNMDMMLNKQGLSRRILNNVLHRHPSVVKNEHESSHLTRWMRGIRKLAEPDRLRAGTYRQVSRGSRYYD
jgi:hypothetical protein